MMDTYKFYFKAANVAEAWRWRLGSEVVAPSPYEAALVAAAGIAPTGAKAGDRILVTCDRTPGSIWVYDLTPSEGWTVKA